MSLCDDMNLLLLVHFTIGIIYIKLIMEVTLVSAISLSLMLSLFYLKTKQGQTNLFSLDEEINENLF